MKKIKFYFRSAGLLILLTFFLTGQDIFAQAVELRGVIKDVSGEAIAGASVIEKGTTTGTVTDINGEFRLTVSSRNAVLQVSFVGFQSQEIRLEGRTFFNITLVEMVSELSEVVVVGYGSQKKESVVGAISQLSTDEILRTSTANITQAISGKISGVITSQVSGRPGADNAQIYIRGRATFAGDAQPLILVDGIERDFSQIAPDDIQTISVLKDASATAVYGVRGANGVILVTTKRGREQKPVVSLTASWQSQSPTRRDTYLDSYQSVLLLEEALANDNLPSQFTHADIEMYRKSSAGQLSGVDAMLYPNVDWYQTILRSTAPAQRYNVNIQGGTKRMRYFTSGELFNQRGLFKNLSLDKYGNESNTNFSRYSFRANLDYLLSSNLTVSVNFGTRFEIRTGPMVSESQIFYELNHTPGWLFPVSYIIGEEGEAKKTLYGGSSQYQNNIYAQFAKGGFYKTESTINETNFIVDYNLGWLTPGLKVKGLVSLDYNANYNRRFSAGFATYELNDRDNYNSIDAYNKFGIDTKLSSLSAQNSNTMKIYFEYQINYARRFGKHDLTAMVLYNKNDLRANAALPQRYQGLVGRVTYGYDDRYLFEFNAGYNGSENFVKGSRFGFFPAFSIGWRITQEDFMASTREWLNNLKIRATYGQVGNDKYAGQRFLYLENWTQGSRYIFGTTTATTITEGAYPNFTVTWERAVKYNLGIEFGLWKDLLKGNFDLFTETRDNILTQYLSRPQWIGITMAAGNLGVTRNSGYEIELNHANKISSAFNYTVGLTYAHAKNKIIDMDEPESKTGYRKREGHAIGQYFGLYSEGFITAADLANPDLPVSTYGDVHVGDLKYRDANKDGYIDDRDVMAIGYSDIPENTFSLSSGFDYKGWSFNITFQGVSHVSRYYDAEAMYAFIDGGKVKKHHLDRWDPSQSEAYNLVNAKYPLLHYDAFGDHNQRLNSFFLQNGAFVRLKNIELSYTLPAAWTRQAGMSNVRLYMNANNLITWDHINGIADPESNGSNRYPIMKAFNFGVNVKF